MRFDELVQYILDEAKGVDPMKFAYKGAPMGFRKDTGVSNPEKFVPTYKGPGDKGKYIEADLGRLMRVALLVTASDPSAGTELKRVLEEFNKLYFNYRNNFNELKSVEDRLAKLPNKESDLAMELKERLKQYVKFTEESKQKVDEATPDVIDAIHDLVKEGGKSFANTLRKSKQSEFKSLQDMNTEVLGDDEKVAIKYLDDLWRGKNEFEPLSKFVEVEKNADKNPAVRLLTIYKTAIDTMVRNNLVGSPERTFNYITGQATKTRSIAEPTKGRVEMKKKDPWLMQTANLIKKRRYEDAKQAVNATKLDNAAKADLMMKIDKLSKGEMTEADVIRPLYAS